MKIIHSSLSAIYNVLKVCLTEIVVTFWEETVVFRAVTSRNGQWSDTEIVNINVLYVHYTFYIFYTPIH